MSIMSLVSLAVSILGVVIYGALFSGSGLVWLFILLSIASVVLPPIAKKIRISRGKKGTVFEIIAIVIGGFNFYCIFFALTDLPLFIGYLGWVISGVAYKMVKKDITKSSVPHACDESKTEKNAPPVDPRSSKSNGGKKGTLSLGINTDYFNAPRSLNYQVSCNYLRKLFLAKDLPAFLFHDNIVFAKAMLEKVFQKCSEEGHLITSGYNDLPITYVSNHDGTCFGCIIEFKDASKECDCNFIGMMVMNGEKVYYTSEYYAGLNSFKICCFYENGNRRAGIGEASPRTIEEFKRAIAESDENCSNLYACDVGNREATEPFVKKEPEKSSGNVSIDSCVTDPSRSSYEKNAKASGPIIPKESGAEVPQLEIRFCRKCGAQLVPNGRFCSQCGTEIAKG